MTVDPDLIRTIEGLSVYLVAAVVGLVGVLMFFSTDRRGWNMLGFLLISVALVIAAVPVLQALGILSR